MNIRFGSSFYYEQVKDKSDTELRIILWIIIILLTICTLGIFLVFLFDPSLKKYNHNKLRKCLICEQKYYSSKWINEIIYDGWICWNCTKKEDHPDKVPHIMCAKKHCKYKHCKNYNCNNIIIISSNNNNILCEGWCASFVKNILIINL